VLLVAACLPGNWVPGEDSVFHTLPGGEFILHDAFTIAPGRVRMSFQDGSPAYGYDEAYPHCDLVLPTISEEPQVIPARSYRIGRIIGQTHYVSRPQRGPVQLAAAQGGNGLLISDGGEEWIMNAYHIALHAETPPERLTLICGGAYNYPFHARYPGLAEMQASLGKYATLKLP
jgi:hypothetical protein